MSTSRHALVAAGLVTAASVVAGVGLLGASAAADSSSVRDDSSVSAVRQATAKFSDVEVAVAHGYVPASPCEQLPGVGAMGVHYLHPELASDGQVVPTRPEVLLYEPDGDGGLTLVGVEYFVAEQAAGGRVPTVQGRPFDGPMAGHGPGMPSHYDLHLWIGRDNPDGMTAAWNPEVSCGTP